MTNLQGIRQIIVVAAFASVAAGAGNAGTVVVNADEWSLTNTGFASAPSTANFVKNLVAEFGTNIHAYSSNFGFTGSDLAAAMLSESANYTVGTGFAFTLANISAYDAIFLGGYYLSAGELADLSTYVANGGNVLINAGTGVGQAPGEAAAWNGFLAPFDIQLVGTYTGYIGNVTTAGVPDPLLAGVSQLYIGSPNGLTGGNVVCCNEEEVLAIARMQMPAVPLPASGLLLGSTILAGGWRAFRAKRRG